MKIIKRAELEKSQIERNWNKRIKTEPLLTCLFS